MREKRATLPGIATVVALTEITHGGQFIPNHIFTSACALLVYFAFTSDNKPQ